MKDETRGAIVIAVILAMYTGAVYLRKATRRPTGEALTQVLGKEASDILKADAVALVPEGNEAIEIWPRGSTSSASLPNRAALSSWLCSKEAPRETAVVMLQGPSPTRGMLERASKEGKLVVEELRGRPVRLECPSRARFFSMEVRLRETPEGS